MGSYGLDQKTPLTLIFGAGGNRHHFCLITCVGVMIMAYGVQLFNASGVEMVSTFVPVFIVDYITSPASGSRTYAPVKGKTLHAYPLSYVGFGEAFGTPPSAVSVSGNRVTWSGVSAQVPLMMVYE